MKMNIYDIKIPPHMAHSKIGREKLRSKFLYYYYTGEFESKIVVNSDGYLLDGLTSVVIAKTYGLEEVEVNVFERQKIWY